MIRIRAPGGVFTPRQWLGLDAIATTWANHSLRVTTRQTFQIHGVVKRDLKATMQAINAAAMDTVSACGDVNRNVLGASNPLQSALHAQVHDWAQRLSLHFKPATRAYYEIWLDEEKVAESGVEHEPIYGDAYLPRKFKIAVGWPGDNCVDVLANDLGIVPTLSAGTTGELTGYMVYVGGGLGMAHAREDDTYPRLASPLGWVPPDRILDVAEAVVTLQRDHGNREDRHRARLKYLVDERGIGWVRDEVGRRAGTPLDPPVDLPPWTAHDHHGVHDGVLGLPVPSGKVADRDGVALRTALRELAADGTVSELRVTPRQDLLLLGIAPDRLVDVEARLRGHGVALAGDVSNLRRLAIACPALPTCGQALGEAERVLPDLVGELEKVFADTGNGDAAVRLNMTGCPNGCARPYTAEIGIVGRTKTTYDVYVGGSPGGDRLAERIRTGVPLDQLPAVLAPVLHRYAGASRGAAFGDWAAGVGVDQMVTWLPEPVVRRRRAATEAST
jgi:sulfite reductase beta subunit-like hemoprotein